MTVEPTEPVMPVTPPAPAPSPAPAPVVSVPPRARSGGILNVLLVGAAIVAIGGVAFAIGRMTAPASAFPGAGRVTDSATVVLPDGSFAPGAGRPGRFALGGELAMEGTVKSIDADSLTLTLENGEEMTFRLAAGTTYREATDASATDVAIGDKVSIKVADGGPTQVGGGGTAPDLTAGVVTVAR